VIEGDFHSLKGPKAIGTSGHHSNFVVQTLDGATGDFAFGFKPVQKQFLMGSQRWLTGERKLEDKK
jgi:hypothetical protein